QRERTLVLARLVLCRAVRGVAPKHRARGCQAVRGPVVHCSRELGHAWNWRVLARRCYGLDTGRLIEVGEAHLLHRIKVVEVAPVLLEAMCGRQRRRVITEVVLAELTGGVAEVVHKLR